MRRLADLREILRYVPQYREKQFVIALDGAIVAHPNFRNILLDISLLRSLRIGVVLVHGAGLQIGEYGAKLGITPSNVDGTGITDLATLELAITAANRVSHEILEGVTTTDARAVCGNVLVAHPAGILKGIDYQYTGRVERVDVAFLNALLEKDIVPVIPPLGMDGEGQTYRLNSDSVAVEVAAALRAVKLIYLTSEAGIMLQAEAGSDALQLIRQLTIEEAEHLLHRQPERVLPSVLSKLQNGVRAARRGVPRIHIVDGRVEEALLAEVFSNEGIGSLIYTNEYLAIRNAEKKDVHALYNLVRAGIDSGELMPRSLEDIEEHIDDFFIFEIDGTPAGCVALHMYPEIGKAEMACLCVNASYENQGIGARLMHYVENRARQIGAKQLYCLSTQAYNYFLQKGGFSLGSPEDLPAERLAQYERNGRRSLVLTKPL